MFVKVIFSSIAERKLAIFCCSSKQGSFTIIFEKEPTEIVNLVLPVANFEICFRTNGILQK